jgi:hypothetical protein
MSARANQLWNESDTLMKSMKSFKMKLMKCTFLFFLFEHSNRDKTSFFIAVRVQNAEMRKHIQNGKLNQCVLFSYQHT